MDWNPPRQEVNVTRMIIYSIIPILDIYSAWRIQKFRVILGIQVLMGFVVGFVQGVVESLGLVPPIDVFSPHPFDYLITIPLSIIIVIYLTRHFARKYNEKIKSV